MSFLIPYITLTPIIIFSSHVLKIPYHLFAHILLLQLMTYSPVRQPLRLVWVPFYYHPIVLGHIGPDAHLFGLGSFHYYPQGENTYISIIAWRFLFMDSSTPKIIVGGGGKGPTCDDKPQTYCTPLLIDLFYLSNSGRQWNGANQPLTTNEPVEYEK